MHSKDNNNNKLEDPFAELFSNTFSRNKIKNKEDNSPKSKSMDDILFSKINPLDISSNYKKTNEMRGTIIFEEEPRLENVQNRVDINSNKKGVNKVKEELLSLLSTQELLERRTPSFKGGLIMNTPESPSIDLLLANDINIKRSVENSIRNSTKNINNNIYSRSINSKSYSNANNYTSSSNNINTSNSYNNINTSNNNFSSSSNNNYSSNSNYINTTNNYINTNNNLATNNYINSNSNFNTNNYTNNFSSNKYSNPLNLNNNFINSNYLNSINNRTKIFNNTNILNKPTGNLSFRNNYLNNPKTTNLGHVGTNIIAKKKHKQLKLKLFTLKQVNLKQKQLIDNLSLAPDNLKYRFYRTICEISNILGFRKLSYSEVHELRLLYNLFSRYGGYFSTNATFLNHIKDKLSGRLFNYLSYVLPLETNGYYLPNFKKKKPFLPTKDELNTVFCIGIYDDIFYFLETLEKSELSDVLVSELLNVFFLVSDSLFKKCECPLFSLSRTISRLSTKPYKIVLERMARNILYQLQEQVFKIILKYENEKRSEEIFNDEALFLILESILKRKSIKQIPDIFELENENLENNWIVNLLIAVNTTIKMNSKIIEILFEMANFCNYNNTNANLIVRVVSKINIDKSTCFKLFNKIESQVISLLKTHVKTIKSKILLNDKKELENIIYYFLPFLFDDKDSIGYLREIFFEYKLFLIEKKVYFRKRKSSNIERIIEYLTGLLNQSYT